MRNKDQIYEVEIKSQAILKENKQSFITYFQGGNRKTIISNVMKLYPQYTKPEDKPVISITAIRFRDYQEVLETGVIKQKRRLVNESLGN